MWNWIVDKVVDDPERMTERGQAAALAGSSLLLVGLVAWAARTMAGAVHHATHAAPLQGFAEVLGVSPWATFWVPESALGWAVALALTAVGVGLKHLAQQVRRAYY